MGYTAENEDPRCVNNQWRAGPFPEPWHDAVGKQLRQSGDRVERDRHTGRQIDTQVRHPPGEG